MANEIKAEI